MRLIKNKKGHHELIILGIFLGIGSFILLKFKKGEKMAKGSLVAALLNFVLWGSGYLYRGERRGFGLVWLVAYIFAHLPIYYLGLRFYYTQAAGILILLAHTTISVLLAYDVYKT